MYLNLYLYVVVFFFFVILIVISFVQLEDPLSAFPVFKKYDRNGYVMLLFHKNVLALEMADVYVPPIRCQLAGNAAGLKT